MHCVCTLTIGTGMPNTLFYVETYHSKCHVIRSKYITYTMSTRIPNDQSIKNFHHEC